MNDIQDSSDNKKHSLFLMKLAGFLIGASLLLTLGLSNGLLSQGVVERAFGVLLGLVMAAYGNATPKFTGTSPTFTDDESVAHTLRRVSGCRRHAGESGGISNEAIRQITGEADVSIRTGPLQDRIILGFLSTGGTVFQDRCARSGVVRLA